MNASKKKGMKLDSYGMVQYLVFGVVRNAKQIRGVPQYALIRALYSSPKSQKMGRQCDTKPPG